MKTRCFHWNGPSFSGSEEDNITVTCNTCSASVQRKKHTINLIQAMNNKSSIFVHNSLAFLPSQLHKKQVMNYHYSLSVLAEKKSISCIPSSDQRMQRVGLGGGLEGGLALQTPPVWFKRPSEPGSDLSLLNQSFVLLHCAVCLARPKEPPTCVCVKIACSVGRSRWFIRQCPNKNISAYIYCVYIMCI